MKISNRLKLIASLVPDDANVLDVGCDHALLDIFLVTHKKNIRAIASDINSGPLKRAIDNVKFYKVDHAIDVKQGDGIVNITAEVDTIIISGLGGNTIIDILKKDLDKLKNVKTLVISPHGEEEKVRRFITSIGYEIADEIFTCDQNKAYVIIKFVRGNKKYTDLEMRYGPIILKNKNEYFYKYYSECRANLKELLKEIPKDKKNIYDDIEEEIERLDKILKV